MAGEQFSFINDADEEGTCTSNGKKQHVVHEQNNVVPSKRGTSPPAEVQLLLVVFADLRRQRQVVVKSKNATYTNYYVLT